MDSARSVYAGVTLTPLRELRPVTPLCVFAAGRKSFKAVVRGADNAAAAQVILFDELPLAENGWDFTRTKISPARMLPQGAIWKLERG